jgi:hypothetical protein
MAAAGKQMEDDDLTSQILAGLDADYQSVFVGHLSIRTRRHASHLSDLFAELLVAEGRLEAGAEPGRPAR